MSRKHLLVAGLFLLVATVAFAPQTPMRQAYYTSAVGSATAAGKIAYANDGTNPYMTFSGTVGGTMTEMFRVNSAGVKLGGAFVLDTWAAWGSSDATPDVAGGAYFYTDASSQTLTDFDGTLIAAGQIIVVESTAAVTFDVTSSGLICGDTDVVTADGDVTMWIYNGTDWQCLAFMDLDDNSNTWGAA